jgi:hypothetical protein
MRAPILLFLVCIVAISFTSPVNAQFADDNVKSDGYGNTAVGTDALFTLTPSNESSLGCINTGLCISNTALGNNALSHNEDGSFNVAAGAGALYMNVGGSDDVAIGINALYNNTACCNTAVGPNALADNATGIFNTGVGHYALSNNHSGSYNTATGDAALYHNDTGNTGASNNTADGALAMYYATSGSNNTAVGFQALWGYSGSISVFGTGSYNTAIGAGALSSYSTGFNNNATGAAALYSNTIGNYNEASGQAALYSNISGSGNEASGHAALFLNTTGSYNVAIGYAAGYAQTTGSNNIYISHRGVAGESGITRIGTPNTQTETYIAGIENAKITGSAVYVTSTGQLGVLASSERYKTGIIPIGTTTERLQQLRPVSFHLKNEPKGAVQYGLIAEEVAKVYPELVIHDEKGRIDGVRYDELAPLLLNELQQQRKTAATQAAEIRDLKHQEQDKMTAQDAKIRGLEQQVAELTDLKQELRAALLKLRPKDPLVAER